MNVVSSLLEIILILPKKYVGNIGNGRFVIIFPLINIIYRNNTALSSSCLQQFPRVFKALSSSFLHDLPQVVYSIFSRFLQHCPQVVYITFLFLFKVVYRTLVKWVEALSSSCSACFIVPGNIGISGYVLIAGSKMVTQ